MSTHLLQQYGKIRNKSQDTTVPNGAFRYISHDECVHEYQIWRCQGRTETNGKFPKGTDRDWKEKRETDVAEDV